MIKIKMNHANLNKLFNAQEKALIATAEAVKTEAINKQVLPFAMGTMQNDSTFVEMEKIKKGVVSLISSTPYSRMLYYNPYAWTIKQGENSNATDHWWEPWLTGNEKDFAKKAFVQLYRRYSGI